MDERFSHAVRELKRRSKVQIGMVGRRAIPWICPARVHRDELIDSYDLPESEFLSCFHDIAILNRYFGGTASVQASLRPYLGKPMAILDVGTGLGEVLKAAQPEVCGPDASSSLPVGLDTNRAILRLAKGNTKGILFVKATAVNLPFTDKSFDIVISSLTFHHLEDTPAIDALREMARVSKKVAIVCDLRRGYLPAILVWAVTRLLSMHRLTRHDAPLSVMRSRTPDEYRNLAIRAGFPNAKVYSHPFWRAALVLEKAE